MNRLTPILVVLGVGSDDKPHAARFEFSELDVARRLAGLMGFRLAKAATDRSQALAKQLPEGKIFASGKGLLPLVKAELFEDLCAIVDFVVSNDPPGTTPAAGDLEPSLRQAIDLVWAGIKPGSQVLIFDDTYGTFPNWCAAIVTGVSKDNETLTVRWRDYYGWGSFLVKRNAVAVLPPTSP